MFYSQTLIRQKARSPIWLNTVIALLVASTSVLFIPFSYEQPILWFSGMFLLSFIIVYLTFGFSSWITLDKEGNYVLCLRDNSSRSNSYLPFEHIRHVEIIPYRSFGNAIPEEYQQREFHYCFKQFGYAGEGLIVVYHLPKPVSGDEEIRSWQIPAPKAEAFFSIMVENAESLNSKNEY